MRAFAVAVAAATIALIQNTPVPTSGPGLSMRYVEACRIDYHHSPRWGGPIATFDVDADRDGLVVNLTRRSTADHEVAAGLVNMDQIDACLRRWRFAEPGAYTVTVSGGTTLDGIALDVATGGRTFRLKISG
jgi:hypothetical protein